ncbi:hypothetical protein AMTRI_Chr02g264060 [Amborella trichopoda]
MIRCSVDGAPISGSNRYLFFLLDDYSQRMSLFLLKVRSEVRDKLVARRSNAGRLIIAAEYMSKEFVAKSTL